MRTITLKEKKQIVLNSDIELGEQEGNGKGRYFMSRFIEPGIAHYDELGDILITKETLNQFIQTMVGCPVIIDHEDVTDKNVDKLRVGSVSKVWFNEYDGYFYCEGILTDPEAIDLVKNKGWNVSCAYSFQSVPKEMHNGKKIDLEFIDGEFLHLAIVKNPRYEGANIVVNSKVENEDKWITIKPNGEDAKGKHLLLKDGESPKEAIERTYGKGEKSDTKEDREDKIKKLISQADSVSMFDSGSIEKREHERAIKQIDDLDITDEEKQKAKEKLLNYHEEILTYKAKAPSQYKVGVAEFNKRVGLEKSQSQYQKSVDIASERDNFIKSLKEKSNKVKKDKKFTELSDILKSAIDDGKLEVKFGDDVYFRTSKKSKSFLKLDQWTKTKYDKLKANNSIGDITMTVLNDLTDFIKSVVSNEKEEEMKEVKNEDKRKLIDEVGGILKGKVDEELWRTVVGKLEKIAYEPSEDDKADNKAKNEEDEEKEAKNKCKNEEDEEPKEDVTKNEDKPEDKPEDKEEDKPEDKPENKKVKNSMRDIVMGGSSNVQEQKLYISRKERLEEGNKY